jgi:hypothetical protein
LLHEIAQFISEQSMRERIVLALRASFVVVALGAALSGRTPPAHAQVPDAAITSGEGSLLEYKIAVNKDELADLRAQIVLLTAKQTEEGEEQARQDTKISIFFSILSLLGTGSIALQFQRKKLPP